MLLTVLSKKRSCICFLKETFLFVSASLWICCVHLCSVSFCFHWDGKPRCDKVEKQMSPSEQSWAPGRELDHERSSSITPISLLYLDMLCLLQPCCVSTLDFFVCSATPLLLLLRALPHSPVVIHLKLMSVLFASAECTLGGRKSCLSASMLTATGVKALGWMLHSSTALYFPIHSAERVLSGLQQV